MAFVVVALACSGVPAQSAGHDGSQTGRHDHHSAARGTAGDEASMTDGEVRKVDRNTRKLTLRHGPIPNLEMTDMTMVFQVADPKMLDGLEAGEKVRFNAERVDGRLTVTRIEMMK
jgi:Cu/Ag efflux protein CusF